MKTRNKAIQLLVIALMILNAGLLHATDLVCTGGLNWVNVHERPFYMPSWGNGRAWHYLCELGEEGTPLCKQKFAIMLTAFSLGKNVQVTYPGIGDSASCSDNLTGVVPSYVMVINW